jgi:hypothetical protein
MLIRQLVVVGLVGFFSFVATIATAEDAGAPTFAAVEGVDLVDPSTVFDDGRFDLSFDAAERARFSGLNETPVRRETNERYHSYEVALTARATDTLGVSFAQRAGVGVNRQGDIESQSRGSELRFGSIGGDRRDRASSDATWYLFAASEDEALTWRPGSRNEFGGTSSSFNVEDRVEIGDLQAGLTYERDRWQASLAYVEREYSVRAGSRMYYREESFAGVTLTMTR